MKNPGLQSPAEKQISRTEKAQLLEPFIARNHVDIIEVANLAGIEILEGESLEEVVTKTQPWAKGDHYDPEQWIELSEEDQASAYEAFSRMGLLHEIQPEGGEYDQILILGGEQNSNHIRLDYAFEHLGTGKISLGDHGTLVCLGGDRPLKGREIPAVSRDIERILATQETDSWAKNILHSPLLEALHEESAMRLAVLARLGEMGLAQSHIRLEGADVISHRLFHGSDTVPNVATVFAPKVSRPLGEARHTTESTLHEWLDTVAPPKGARILFVSNAPYAIRTARNLLSVVESLRPDIVLDFCAAPAAYDDLLVRRCYGELARLIYEDARL